MQKSSVLGFLLALVALAGGAFWFLTNHGKAPSGLDPTQAAPVDPGSASPIETAPGDPTSAPSKGERTAVLPGERPQSQSGFAITGQVLDDAGHPLAAAVVSALPGFGGSGGRGGPFGGFGNAGEDFDPTDFDVNAMVERVRTEMKKRVEVTTDAEGRFRIVPPGENRDVQLRVLARGFVALDKTARRPTTANVDLGALALQRGALLAGRVVDAQNRGIEGARVQRLGRREMQFGAFEIEFPGADLFESMRDGEGGLTDAEGRFELPHAEPGEFALRARHQDHPQARLENQKVAPGESLTNLTIVMEPGVTLSGVVVGIPEGTKGLRVQAAQKRAATPDAAPQNGRFDVNAMLGMAGDMLADSGLPLGEKSVELDAENRFRFRGLRMDTTYRIWVAQTQRGFAGDGASSEVKEAPSGANGIELRYDPGITVTFTVQDAEAHSAVERLWVTSRLTGGGNGLPDFLGGMGMFGGARAKTYPEGKVTITNLRPKKNQKLQLTVEALGYASVQREGLALPTSGSLELGVLEAKKVPTIRVTAIANDTGKPLAGAAVRVQAKREPGNGGRGMDWAGGLDQMGMFGGRGGGGGNPRSARTDAEGKVELNPPQGSAATLSITAQDYAPYEQELALAPTKTTEHEARILRGGSVLVSVFAGDGKPLPKANVERSGAIGRRDTRQSDAQGVVTFEHLTPGTHKFRLADNRGGRGNFGGMQVNFQVAGAPAADDGWTSVEVLDGAEARVELKKPLTASLRGVVRENGTSLAEARVAFVKGTGSGADSPEGQIADMFGQMGGGGRGGGGGGRTGEDGAYALNELPIGPHRLRITHRGRAMPTTIAIDLRPGENVFDIALDATALRGTVRDPAGKPVANATIVVKRAGGADDPLAGMNLNMGGMDFGQMGGNRTQVKSDDQGRYEVRGVQPGIKLTVAATAKGFSRAALDVEVASGTTRDGLDLQLGAAGSIQVAGPALGAFGAARATLLGAGDAPEAGAPPVSTMLRRGAGTLEGLKPGRWKVELMGMNGPQGEAKIVEVTAGQTANVAF